MKRLVHIIMFILVLASCEVHEWPAMPDKVDVVLKLDYETDMTKWHWQYSDGQLTEIGLGEKYDNALHSGQMRYIVRTYPVTGKSRASLTYAQEFIFYKDIAEGYEHEVTLGIIPGDYEIMVWSDLQRREGEVSYYDASDFYEVTLQGEHIGNTDYRDAFRGTSQINVVADYVEHIPDTVSLVMQRPLAKYEFLTDDLQSFVNEELEYLSKVAQTKGESVPTRVNTNDYKVVIYYSGYMPDTFNISSDKPVDSVTGVMFESHIDVLNETESLIGFDYVFVNGMQAGVSVQIGLYAKEDDRQVALSNPIILPLYRSHHTILRGSFMTQQASGGLKIEASFDGNHNIVIE